jgi:hypothetical protein
MKSTTNIGHKQRRILVACLGVTKIPLAFVVHVWIAPENVAANGWLMHQAPSIVHALVVLNDGAVPLVFTEHFKTDNTAVLMMESGFFSIMLMVLSPMHLSRLIMAKVALAW